MPDFVTKTTDQMDPVADVLDDDELLVSRGGVIGVSTVEAVRTALGEKLAAEFSGEDLGVALAAADISTVNAAATAADRELAANAADRAVLAAATKGSYPNSAATVVPKGVTTVAITAPGAGYTNGVDYVGTFTGGGGGFGARFLFDVVAGAVANVHGVEPGYGYTVNPVPVFDAAPAGAGAAGTATVSDLVLSGEFYWAASADGATERMHQNVAGAATEVAPPVIRGSGVQTIVRMVQTNDSGNLLQIQPAPGYSVPADPTAALFDLEIKTANPDGVGILVKGAGFLPPADDIRQMVRPDGVQILGGVLTPGLRALFSYTALGKFWLLSPSAGPAAPIVDVKLIDGTTGTNWNMHPVQTLSNNSGLGVVFRIFNPPVRTEGSLLCRILGINDVEQIEIRGATGLADDPFPQDGISGPNHTVFITRDPNGSYRLLRIERPADAIAPPAGSFTAFATRTAAAVRALSAYGH